MEKAKFYVDFCFEAGDAGICHRYWFEIELSNEEFEELYKMWYDQDELNSWSSIWEGHETLFQKINGVAVYAPDNYLEQEKPVYRNPLDVLWELSQETKDAFKRVMQCDG